MIVVVVTVIVGFIITAVYFYISYPIIDQNIFKSTISYDKNLLSNYIKYNVNTFLSMSFKSVNRNIFDLVIGGFVNLQTYGIYTFFKKLFIPLHLITDPLTLIAYPRFVEYFNSKQKNKVIQITHIVNFIQIMVIFGISVLALILIPKYFPYFEIPINKLSLSLLYINIIITLLSSTVWWTRIYSNAVDTRISLKANMYATVYNITITLSAGYVYSIYGVLLSEIVLLMSLNIFWYYTLLSQKNEWS